MARSARTRFWCSALELLGLRRYRGFVEDSGESHWTVNATDGSVPAEVLTAPLCASARPKNILSPRKFFPRCFPVSAAAGEQ
jgi:hypothetical protein